MTGSPGSFMESKGWRLNFIRACLETGIVLGKKGHLISFNTCMHESTFLGWLSIGPAFAHCLCRSISLRSVSVPVFLSVSFPFQFFFFYSLCILPSHQVTSPFLLSKILKWPPRLSTPCHNTCIISRTTNLMDFNSVMKLYYMAQLTLRKGDYVGGPGLIRWTLKGSELFLRKRLEVWEGASLLLALEVEGATWHELQAASRSQEQILVNSEQGSKNLNSITTHKNWLWPTASKNLEVDWFFLGASMGYSANTISAF